jgi:hypothetical protein
MLLKLAFLVFLQISWRDSIAPAIPIRKRKTPSARLFPGKNGQNIAFTSCATPHH